MSLAPSAFHPPSAWHTPWRSTAAAAAHLRVQKDAESMHEKKSGREAAGGAQEGLHQGQESHEDKMVDRRR